MSSASNNSPSHAGPCPFHAGELRAQALAGGGASGSAIRDFMPEQHRAFFAAQRFLLLAACDDDGRPAVTVVSGAPGFASSPDACHLRLAVAPDPDDPVRPLLRPGRQAGLLGIDFATRRRNRANGVITTVDGDGMLITMRQSFGNCPKYIQPRVLCETAPASAADAPPEYFIGLDRQARDRIARADTFFVATSAGGEGGGVDVSHRGGPAGFIRIDGDTLTVPDFRGNRYFNTLGNLLLEPRAALLFIDFSNGGLLHLQGSTELLWDADAARDFPGAERLWRFHAERGGRRRGALPLRWQAPPQPASRPS